MTVIPDPVALPMEMFIAMSTQRDVFVKMLHRAVAEGTRELTIKEAVGIVDFAGHVTDAYKALVDREDEWLNTAKHLEEISRHLASKAAKIRSEIALMRGQDDVQMADALRENLRSKH